MPQFMPQLRLILVYSGLSTFTKVLVRLDEIDSGLFWFTYRHSFKSCHLDFLFPCESREIRRFWNVYAPIMPQFWFFSMIRDVKESPKRTAFWQRFLFAWKL